MGRTEPELEKRDARQLSVYDCVGIKLYPKAGSEGVATFECLSCDIPLQWSHTDRWWICQGCEYSVTLEESLFVIEKGTAMINKLRKLIRKTKGGRWHWLPW